MCCSDILSGIAVLSILLVCLGMIRGVSGYWFVEIFGFEGLDMKTALSYSGVSNERCIIRLRPSFVIDC